LASVEAEGFIQLAKMADAADGVDGAGEDEDRFSGGGTAAFGIALTGVREGELGVKSGGLSGSGGVQMAERGGKAVPGFRPFAEVEEGGSGLGTGSRVVEPIGPVRYGNIWAGVLERFAGGGDCSLAGGSVTGAGACLGECEADDCSYVSACVGVAVLGGAGEVDGLVGLAASLAWRDMVTRMFAPIARSPAAWAARRAARQYRWAWAGWPASSWRQPVR
jgi:hypothetical protein